MTQRDMTTVDERQLGNAALAILRAAPRSVIRLPCSGLDAARRVAATLLPSAPPPGVVCGSIHGSHAYGGSVVEGTRHFVRVVLEHAVVEAEEYDNAADTATHVYVWTTDEALRARIHALVGTG